MNMAALELRPLLAVVVSLVAAGAVMLTPRGRPNLREAWTFVAAIVKAALVLSLVPATLAGELVETAPLELAPGVALHLRVDALGLLFALVASMLWVVTSLYSVGYMRTLAAPHQRGYFASFAVCVSAAVGIAFSANLLTFFVFFEILTIATYPLVVHKRNGEAKASGRKYLSYTLVAGQCLLVAVLWVSHMLPGAEFTPGGFLAAAADNGAISTRGLQGLFVLFMLGVGVKAGLMPIHAWLPAAMVAPTPVSALLHAVAVVKAGVFGVLRVTGFVFGPELVTQLGVGLWLAAIAAITIIVASVIALGQDNLKRRLAYSTVGQLSYIVLGAALATPAATLGATIHIAAHAFMKITLFFCAGSIYAHTHKTKVSELDGLGRQMPVTFAAFTIASLGLAGVPLFAGFVSKWNLAKGALEADQWPLVLVLMTSGLLNIAYFFPIVVRGYFGARDKAVRVDEAPMPLLLPPVFAAAMTVLLGVAPNAGPGFYALAERVSASMTAGTDGGAQ